MKYQTFKVSSNFEFPLDMLRYDSCFPATETDASLIYNSIVGHKYPTEVEIGRFVRIKVNLPSLSRWESFNCKISNIETR